MRNTLIDSDVNLIILNFLNSVIRHFLLNESYFSTDSGQIGLLKIQPIGWVLRFGSLPNLV